MSLSVVTCFHKRSIEQFRNSLETLKLQTIPPTEIILSDYSKLLNPEMKQLCQEYNVKHLFLDMKQPEKTLALNYFTVAINAGIRQATSNLILHTGIDYLFKDTVLSLVHEAYKKNPNSLITAPCYNLGFTPKKTSKKSMDLMWKHAKRKSRGQAIICAERGWWLKIRGYDQRLWRGEDEDLIRRARLDNRKIIRLKCGIYHQPHRASRHEYADKRDEKDAVFYEVCKEQTVIRNDDEWGVIA